MAYLPFYSGRDETLEALSDAQFVAPAAKTVDLHSVNHRNSFLYVFDYQTKYGDFPQVIFAADVEHTYLHLNQSKRPIIFFWLHFSHFKKLHCPTFDAFKSFNYRFFCQWKNVSPINYISSKIFFSSSKNSDRDAFMVKIWHTFSVRH